MIIIIFIMVQGLGGIAHVCAHVARVWLRRHRHFRLWQHWYLIFQYIITKHTHTHTHTPASAICGGSWRRCFASLYANAVRGPISRIFTSTYENFLQTAGLQDGASHCAKILSAMYASLNSDPSCVTLTSLLN